MSKVTDDLLGINMPKIPDMQAAAGPSAATTATSNDANDAAAAAQAKKRAEDEKLRRGRSSMRVDSNSTTGGAGVTIPK